MLRILPFLAFILLAVLPVANAAEKKVPRILFLGDPVQQRVVNAAAKELKGKASIASPKATPAYDSGSALARLDELLGGEEWDLVYFNFGVGELFHKDPATREIRVMSKDAGGVPVSTPEQYGKNLEELVKRLRASGAKLLWGSTTPLVTVNFFASFEGNLFEAGSEVERNAVAAQVMKRHQVPVVDLHTYVMASFEKDEKHPAYSKYDEAMAKKGKPLHAPLVEAILKELP